MRVLVATSVHLPDDARIVRQLQTLVGGGHRCTLHAAWLESSKNYPFEMRYFPRYRGLAGRLRVYARFLRLSLFERWDAIHFHDFDLCLCAIVVRLLTWRKIVYDVHENYAEEVLVRAYIPYYVRRPLMYLVLAVEWIAARFLGRVVVVVPVQVERFKRWGCRSVTLVRNFAPTSFAPAAAITARTPRPEDCVLNTGSQTVDYGSLLVLAAAAELYRRGVPISIMGIDRFEGSPGLRERVFATIPGSAPNYRIVPRIPPHEVGRYMDSAVIGLSVMLDTPNKRIAYPTKLFEYMAYGIPIIATDVGLQAEIIRESGAGILVPANDPNALADAIESLWFDAAARDSLGRAGRKAFFSSYCWESEGDRLLSLYRSMDRCKV